MTFISCLAIGLAFLIAVALLVFAAILIGWYVPEVIEQSRRAGLPKKPDETRGSEPPAPDRPDPPP